MTRGELVQLVEGTLIGYFVAAMLALVIVVLKAQKGRRPQQTKYVVYQGLDSVSAAMWIGLPLIVLASSSWLLFVICLVAAVALLVAKHAVVFGSIADGGNRRNHVAVAAMLLDVGLAVLLFTMVAVPDLDPKPGWIFGYLIAVAAHAALSRLCFPAPSEFKGNPTVPSMTQGGAK